jgi:ribosome-associated translation inhibitor RaiA
MTEETIELGGSIRLSGFSEVDGGSLIIIKKLIGSFVKKVSEKNSKFQSLSMTLKTVHTSEKSDTTGKFEIKVLLAAEKNYSSEVTHMNLMFAIDKVLKKVETQMD